MGRQKDRELHMSTPGASFDETPEPLAVWRVRGFGEHWGVYLHRIGLWLEDQLARHGQPKQVIETIASQADINVPLSRSYLSRLGKMARRSPETMIEELVAERIGTDVDFLKLLFMEQLFGEPAGALARFVLAGEALSGSSGSSEAQQRADLLREMFLRATPEEQDALWRVVRGYLYSSASPAGARAPEGAPLDGQQPDAERVPPPAPTEQMRSAIDRAADQGGATERLGRKADARDERRQPGNGHPEHGTNGTNGTNDAGAGC